ncbi:MAG TPA: N-methyl-L-tryptophan oxidase [Vicinamibacteria bacterium]|nr:N-methyl-L-tryptophan oxidase [Vicinamibacteria bacterium]
MSAPYDVIVIGLGGMGSATAYQLARRGKRVLGLERFTPAHDRGSSHGRSRVIRQAYFEDPAYVPLLLRAYELWEQLERESGRTVLTITGGLMLGREESQTFAGTLRSARQWGLAHEVMAPEEIHRRFPPMRPSPDLMGFYETKAGFVHPEDSVWAHLQQALRHSADLHFTEPAVSWTADARGVTVTTERGRYEAGSLVLAPGAWAPELVADLALPFAVTRQTLYWFDPVGGPGPFAVGAFPIYIWEMDEGAQIYGFPAQPGVPGVKVAFFYDGVPCDPNDVNRVVSEKDVARMRDALGPRIPSLAGALRGTATCLYTELPDHHFVIASHPRHENVVVASPCSGHGYKFCSVVGEILADLALERRTRHPIALFDPARFPIAR